MRKKIFLLVLLTSCAISLFGQNRDIDISSENIGGGYNSLVLSFEANTGRLSDDTDGGPFSGNAFDFAAEGSHTFGSLPWLSLYGKIDFRSSINVNNENLRAKYPDEDKTKHPNIYPVYMMNGTTGSSFGLNYIDLGARLGGWGSVGFRHNLLLKGEARIPLTIQLLGSSDEPTFAINGNGMKLAVAPSGGNPVSISVALYGGINAFPYRIGKWWDVLPGDKVGVDAAGERGKANEPSITDLYGGITISTSFGWTDVPVVEDFGLALDASWHTNGNTIKDNSNAGYTPWDCDSAEALKYNGFLRVQATLSYAPNSKFSAYARCRYEYTNILPTPQGTYSIRDRMLHDFYVMAGVSYKLGGEK